MKNDPSSLDKSALLMRLERNQNDLRQLRCALNSYTCEPRTHSLFERIESLRHALEDLTVTNSEIINALKAPKKSIGNSLEQAMQQFTEFSRLQKGVEEYVAGARNC